MPIPLPRPSFSPKSSLPPKSAIPPKPSFGVMEFLGLKPMPKPEQKPPVKPAAKGLFGEKNEYRSFGQLRDFAQKAPDRPVPGFGGTLYKSDRKEAEKRLEGYAKQYLGRTYGLSPRDLGSVTDRSSILGKLSQEIEKAKKEGRWDEAKKLQKDIKIYEQLKKGF